MPIGCYICSVHPVGLVCLVPTHLNPPSNRRSLLLCATRRRFRTPLPGSHFSVFFALRPRGIDCSGGKSPKSGNYVRDFSPRRKARGRPSGSRGTTMMASEGRDADEQMFNSFFILEPHFRHPSVHARPFLYPKIFLTYFSTGQTFCVVARHGIRRPNCPPDKRIRRAKLLGAITVDLTNL